MSKRTIVLASVMIVCNGAIGLCLLMGSIRLLPENAPAEDTHTAPPSAADLDRSSLLQPSL